MNCMKCGRETAADQVFCQECCLEMEKYPVKPGTVVLLPNRREPAAPKKTTRRRSLSPEEQVKQLRKLVRVLAAMLTVSVLLVLFLIYPAVKGLLSNKNKIGQNYTAIVATTAPAEDAE